MGIAVLVFSVIVAAKFGYRQGLLDGYKADLNPNRQSNAAHAISTILIAAFVAFWIYLGAKYGVREY